MPWTPSSCAKKKLTSDATAICNTLRSLFAASLEVEHDRRSRTLLLLTFGQAAELLGVGEATVRELVAQQELRSVTVQS